MLYTLSQVLTLCKQNMGIRDLPKPVTDKDLRDRIINSALKVLEKNGVVELSFAEGNRKSKQIRLTDKGMKLCMQLVEPLIHAENKAFSILTETEQELLVSLSQKYIEALQNEISLSQKRSK